MEIILIPDPLKPTSGSMYVGQDVFDCALGRGGFSRAKQEGDGTTPLGRFALRRVLYRGDRVTKPKTGLPITALRHTDGWCDDADDPLYNQPVTHPYMANAERLWREDNRYDVIVVLGHNDNPVIVGAGSAIFLHVAAKYFRPTEGCVAMQHNDLIDVLSQCEPGDTINIRLVRDA
ncbi:MAG: L,D-transpeptidase family protein [Rhodospirillaceae bacterium]|nr:L,D-transpeptidase family protein [Rhodospirillaceae bacterium]